MDFSIINGTCIICKKEAKWYHDFTSICDYHHKLGNINLQILKKASEQINESAAPPQITKSVDEVISSLPNGKK